MFTSTLPVIIDLEASGFGARGYPIEVGVALADTSTVCHLIRPQAEWTHWDSATEQVHGLTRDILLRYGKSASEVAGALNALLATQTVYSDAWGFDQTWLSMLFEAGGLQQRFRIEALQALFTEQQFEVWNTLKDRVMAESQFSRHRASSDAQAIQLTWRRMLELTGTS